MRYPLYLTAVLLTASCATQPAVTAKTNFCGAITDASVRSAIDPDCAALQRSIANTEAQGLSTPETNVQVSVLVLNIIGRTLHGLSIECIGQQLDERLPAGDRATFVDVLPPAPGATPMPPVSDDRGRSLVSSLVRTIPDIQAACITTGT